MAYRRKKDGRWVEVIELPPVVTLEGTRTRKRKAVYGRTRREAEAAGRALRELHEQGVPIDARDGTVAELFAHWLSAIIHPDHGLHPLARHTYLGYESRARLHVVPFLGHHPLRRMTPQHVERWLAERLAATGRRRTIQYAHQVLRSALDYAMSQNLVARNVADAVQAIHVEKARVIPLTVTERRALLAAVAPHPRLETIITVALHTGLRMGELLGLEWANVDLGRGLLVVERQAQHGELARLKTPSARRYLPLSRTAAGALERQERELKTTRMKAGKRWVAMGLVFPSTLGTPWNPSNLRKALLRALEGKGLDRFHMHLTRHSFATVQLAEGAPLHEVTSLLGHSTLAVTKDFYGHLEERAVMAAAERVERGLKDAG